MTSGGSENQCRKNYLVEEQERRTIDFAFSDWHSLARCVRDENDDIFSIISEGLCLRLFLVFPEARRSSWRN